MLEAGAIAAYLVFFTLVAYVCERWSPLVGIGGLLLILAVAKML
jgi:hypothetical protein